MTAYEGLRAEDLPRLRPDECDLMIFPDGVALSALVWREVKCKSVLFLACYIPTRCSALKQALRPGASLLSGSPAAGKLSEQSYGPHVLLPTSKFMRDDHLPASACEKVWNGQAWSTAGCPSWQWATWWRRT